MDTMRDMRKRLAGAFLIAGFAAVAMTVTTVTLHAYGDYNLNPAYCRSSSPLDPLWWWNECWKPDPPDWEQGG